MNIIKFAEKLYESANENGLVETLFAVYGKNIKVNIAYTKRACETSIDEIDFSVRSSNALKRTGLMTIGDVIDAIADDRLLKVRNLGRKSYCEIKTRIMKFGYDQLTEKEKLAFFVNLVEQNHKEPLKKAV